MSLLEKAKRISEGAFNDVYPGCKWPVVLLIEGEKCIYDDEEMKSDNAVNKIAQYVGNILSSNSTHYSERTFVYDREYGIFDEIASQTLEDYDIDVNALNCLQLAKAMVTSSCKEETEKVYFLWYSPEDGGLIYYHIFESEEEIEQFCKENF